MLWIDDRYDPPEADRPDIEPDYSTPIPTGRFVPPDPWDNPWSDATNQPPPF